MSPSCRKCSGTFKLVPFAVGEVTADEVAAVFELLWGGGETLFVVSSDLSHFHDYETAARVDAETSHTIEALRVEDLTGERCCGFRPIGGLLQAARTHGLRVRKLDLRSSGDTAGPRDRVVGYGAFVLEDSADDLTAEHRRTLLDVAVKSIEAALDEGHEFPIAAKNYPERLRVEQACFVTLHVGGKLRGCMGSLEATEPLVVNVGTQRLRGRFSRSAFWSTHTRRVSATGNSRLAAQPAGEAARYVGRRLDRADAARRRRIDADRRRA